MSHRNPKPRPPGLRLVSDLDVLESLTQRLAPPDVDGILRKTRLLEEIARLRLRELKAPEAKP